jgi:hypothetical protein
MRPKVKGPATVRFVPIKDGDVIDDGSDSVFAKRNSTKTVNHLVGFKPGRAGQREGWLVYLVHTEAPRSAQVHKRR